MSDITDFDDVDELLDRVSELHRKEISRSRELSDEARDSWRELSREATRFHWPEFLFGMVSMVVVAVALGLPAIKIFGSH